jgi:hypothetical protein
MGDFEIEAPPWRRAYVHGWTNAMDARMRSNGPGPNLT